MQYKTNCMPKRNYIYHHYPYGLACEILHNIIFDEREFSLFAGADCSISSRQTGNLLRCDRANPVLAVADQYWALVTMTSKGLK